MKVLVAEGLVRVHRGVGTIVRELEPLIRDASVRHTRDPVNAAALAARRMRAPERVASAAGSPTRLDGPT
jgi:DNA-binding FadR family transcriptional regulator